MSEQDPDLESIRADDQLLTTIGAGDPLPTDADEVAALLAQWRQQIESRALDLPRTRSRRRVLTRLGIVLTVVALGAVWVILRREVNT